MSDPSLVEILSNLRARLEELGSFTLPRGARWACQDALANIQALQSALAASQQQQERLAAVYRLSQNLGASLDPDQALGQVMDAVIELTRAERGFLMLLHPETQQLELRVARNFEGETLERKDLEISTSFVRSVLEQGRGMVTTNAQTDPRFANQNSVVLYALRSIMCTVLRARGQTIGVIYVDHRAQTNLFNAQDLEMLDAFAAQAAVAIENANLYARTDQKLAERVSELEELAEIDRQLNADLDFQRVVEITRQLAIQGTQADSGWIALAGPGAKALKVVDGDGQESEMAFDDPRVGEAWRQAAAQVFTASGGQPARLVAPVLRAGKPIGLLGVARPANFLPADLRYLSRLAGHAAIALDNAQLYYAVQEANQAKSKFVSVVVHELRIPMTSIKGYADLLRQGAVGPINDAQMSFLDVIRNNVNRMSALVSDLSDISRVESGRLALKRDWISLAEQVQQVAGSLGPRIAEKKQSLLVEIPADLPPVYADPHRIAQVLTNLLSNAWKYSPEGGSIRVSAGLKPPDSHGRQAAWLEVADSGIGIAAEDQARLFTQFFRSEDPAVREQPGWGLGLSVARSLVHLMGGEIGARSTHGRGSTFWVTLPTAPPPEAPAD
jgi:signal transduction histidine kinase